MEGCLDLDVGNTLLKWRYGDARGSMTSHDLPPFDEAPARVRISSVAGAAVRQTLRQNVRAAYGVEAEFAETVSRLAGVTCGYEVPSQLGVDRWLAVVAGWNLVREACVVVDLGTAATLDFVTADGMHRGGYIVPGLSLMARSLAQETADVRVAGELSADLEPGHNTAHAVRRGITAMLLGFVEASVARFARGCETAPAVLLTGGDAEIIANRLSIDARVVPELVLDGLQLALP